VYCFIWGLATLKESLLQVLGGPPEKTESSPKRIKNNPNNTLRTLDLILTIRTLKEPGLGEGGVVRRTTSNIGKDCFRTCGT